MGFEPAPNGGSSMHVLHSSSGILHFQIRGETRIYLFKPATVASWFRFTKLLLVF